MDNSKEYTEMCQKAVEIQELFKAEKGDFYYCFCTDIKPTDMFPKGYGLSIITEWDADLNSELVIRSETDIWLPRQDQLQEIWKPDRSDTAWALNSSFTAFLNVFDVYTPTEKSHMSMEQLWLAFVMHEKFSKKWANGEWKLCDTSS